VHLIRTFRSTLTLVFEKFTFHQTYVTSCPEENQHLGESMYVILPPHCARHLIETSSYDPYVE